jgi:hypothetical protein
MEIDSLPSVYTIGSRKLTNFRELPSKLTEVKYLTEVSMIHVVISVMMYDASIIVAPACDAGTADGQRGCSHVPAVR